MAPGRFMKDGSMCWQATAWKTCGRSFRARSNPATSSWRAATSAWGLREQAAQALKHLGVAAVLAPSFAGLFYRNAINIGLPVLVCADTTALADGARATFFLDAAEIRLCDGRRVSCEPVPDFLRALLHAGGLVPHLKARLNKV
jgi:3-isopropylmalate/(R)-2-methylmalate dehydratase small subunit